MSPADDGEDVGRLLAWGLKGRARPANEPEYKALLRRYRTSADFRLLTEAVAQGLGLLVLHSGERGLILGATEDSPFALRLSDYRQGLSVEDRLVHGLVQLAIAAWCFPTASALEDPEGVVVQVSVGDVVRYLRELCEELEARAEIDPELGTPELREAWRVILAKPTTRDTPDGRRTASSLAGMVAYALETLGSAGLMRRRTDDDGGTWQALASYRVHVRELSAHQSLQLVRRASRGIEP